MHLQLTKEQASKISGLTAGLSLAVAMCGAFLVEPIIIGIGALGAAAAAYVKLSTNGHNSQPYNPSNHPMRRATDRNASKLTTK